MGIDGVFRDYNGCGWLKLSKSSNSRLAIDACILAWEREDALDAIAWIWLLLFLDA